jgi:arylsulfatase A
MFCHAIRAAEILAPSNPHCWCRSALLVLVVATLIPGTASMVPGQSEPRKPNVVLIMADDLGYECLGVNGGKSYRTPRLDALVRDGMRFEHCYSQPLCTPSRVQLMTGRYNQRNYLRFGFFAAKEATIGQVFRRAGYATGIAGKWQLGGGLDAPHEAGFDQYCLWQLTRRGKTLGSRYPNPTLEQNGKILDKRQGEYGPDVVSDFVVDFITKHKERPFFVYYPMILPHYPHEPTPDSTDWDPKAPGLDVEHKKGSAAHFADMVAYMDKMVGKVVDALEKNGLRDNTLILFTGDNGTHRGIASEFRDGTITGGKGSMTDAGTHVPLIAHWPGTVAGGKVSQDLVDFSDFLPTLCEACGIDRPAGHLDGQSFAPQLRGQPGQPRDWVYCWYEREGRRNQARQFARTKRYKLYGDGRFYDVADDPLEQQPLRSDKLDEAASKTRAQLQAVLDRMFRHN